MLHPDNPAILVLGTKPEEVVRYAWPGGYPVFYLTRDNSVLCPGCVQEEIDDEDGEVCDPESSGYVVAHDANWENPHLYCDECGGRIESAYAEDDDTND